MLYLVETTRKCDIGASTCHFSSLDYHSPKTTSSQPSLTPHSALWATAAPCFGKQGSDGYRHYRIRGHNLTGSEIGRGGYPMSIRSLKGVFQQTQRNALGANASTWLDILYWRSVPSDASAVCPFEIIRISGYSRILVEALVRYGGRWGDSPKSLCHHTAAGQKKTCTNWTGRFDWELEPIWLRPS